MGCMLEDCEFRLKAILEETSLFSKTAMQLLLYNNYKGTDNHFFLSGFKLQQKLLSA